MLGWLYGAVLFGLVLAYYNGYARGWDSPAGNLFLTFGPMVGLKAPSGPFLGAVALGILSPLLVSALPMTLRKKSRTLVVGRPKLALALLLATSAGALAGSHRLGAYRARRESAASESTQAVFVTDGDGVIPGQLISCSESHCLIRSDDKVLVVQPSDIKQRSIAQQL